MDTWDEAAFEQFCADLVSANFSPVAESSLTRWKGPIRPSLRAHTTATRMEVRFYSGWPLRYARVIVEGLGVEHAANGVICLWAEDDPSQITGRNLQALWNRVDEWAAVAGESFRDEDRALDSYLYFEPRTTFHAELPFADFIDIGTNGYRAPLTANRKGSDAVMIVAASPPDTPADVPAPLLGSFYLRNRIATPPRNFGDVVAALTRKQKQDLERGLARRRSSELLTPSGGYDFIVLAWPRHDREHDAVVLGFQGADDTLQAFAMAATANDITARKRRAGPDTGALSGLTVLIAGAGSVGGHVAVALASSGVSTIKIHDSDNLSTGNLVRHVSREFAVGYQKTIGVAIEISSHAPWASVEPYGALPFESNELARLVRDNDLVIDCTGSFSMTAALAETCRRTGTPLISGAIFHQGALARIQRQAQDDTLIAARHSDPRYYDLPPEDASRPQSGFLELGCTAPVNNAPPIVVLSTAAEIASAAIDHLTGRNERPDERIVVFRTLASPFDRTGTFDPSPQQPVP